MPGRVNVVLGAGQRKERRLTACSLFQTPKNQIKQKKMAPPPKKVEESEEEESSELEESSGEEVIQLEMKSKGRTCYKSVVRVGGYITCKELTLMNNWCLSVNCA